MPAAAPAPAAAPPVPPAPPDPAADADDRRVVAMLIAIQLAASLGFFAVMAHVVAHLRDDVGLMAGTIGLVLGVRLGVQYALLLPVGAVTDLLGATRTGAIACALRAVGFVLLGTADGTAALLCAAVVLGAGGALFHPAAHTLLAGVHPDRRSRGFAAYIATQHIAAVAGPPVGLALLALGPGFILLAGVAASTWMIAVALFLLLPRREKKTAPPRPRDIVLGVRAVLRDRTFVLFALMTAPTTLLANHMMTVVPLQGFSASTATLCFCVLAALAASAQPWVAAAHRGERPWVLRFGLLCAAATYVLLAPLDGDETGVLMVAAVLNGISNGLVQPSIFQRTARHAPPDRFGSYYGVLSFLSGIFACVGGLVVGRLFDQGPAGMAAALIGIGACALVAAAGTRGP
ncbi:MFS transporter [Actinomadura sp. 9N407]|uniref:MFS transporter n=1 Tax=Actinomadura sp. 9N407 TaxID=3375154 RepID=UPI003790D5E1